MAGGKKKKKPASNPARGFATTSVASKPRADADYVPESIPPTELQDEELQNQKPLPTSSDSAPANQAQLKTTLTPEEFEKQLEDSELQILVEKYAQKSKRDALRQKTRLETDRRVLRSQAETLSTRKWLPPELMEEILDLVKTEGRYTGQATEISASKPVSEEDLTIRLWTLQQALAGAGFVEERINLALRHVLDISDKIGMGTKDVIWGMEESLDWLARESSREELPDYDQRRVTGPPKSQTGK